MKIILEEVKAAEDKYWKWIEALRFKKGTEIYYKGIKLSEKSIKFLKDFYAKYHSLNVREERLNSLMEIDKKIQEENMRKNLIQCDFEDFEKYCDNLIALLRDDIKRELDRIKKITVDIKHNEISKAFTLGSLKMETLGSWNYILSVRCKNVMDSLKEIIRWKGRS